MTDLVNRNEEMDNFKNFGAYAIILENPVSNSLKNAYETILKRFEVQCKDVKFACIKNDEVRFKHLTSLMI